MTDQSKTTHELLEENAALKKRIRECEETEQELKRALEEQGKADPDRTITVEEELRKKDREINAFFDAVQESIVLIHTDGTVALSNMTGAQRLGKTVQEFLGTCLYDHFPPEVASLRKSKYEQVITTGEPLTFEDVRAGRIFEQRCYPVFNDEKQVTGVTIFARDVTELHQAYESLRANEQKYRVLFEESLDAILLTVPDGSILDANPAACEMFGRSVDEIRAVGRDGVVDVSDPRLPARLEERTRTGRMVNVELTLVRATGERFPAEVMSKVFTDTQGRQRTCMLVRDISERKRLEGVLRECDILLEKLAAHAPGMIYQFMRNPDGTFCIPFVTEAIRDIFGCSPEDVREDFAPITNVVVPEDLEKFISSIESSAEDMVVWECEFRVQVPGKPVRWILGKSTPEKLPDGSIIWHGFATDITDSKEAQAALIRSEDNFRRSLEDSPFGIRIVSKEGKTLYVNCAFLDMLEYDSISGWETPPNRRYTMKGREEHLIRKEKRRSGTAGSEEYEIEIIDRKGTIRTIQVWRKPVIWNGEEQYQVLYEDITDRKRAEEAREAAQDELQESLERLQGILDNSPLLITEITNEGRYRLVNRAVCDLYGKEESELLGRLFHELQPKKTADLFMERIVHVRESRSALTVEDSLPIDGNVLYFSTVLFPLLDSTGDVRAVGAIAADITDHKQVEKALRESEEQYRTLVEAAAESIFIAQDERIKFCNKAFSDFIGYTVEAVATMPFTDMIHPEDQQMVLDRYMQRLEGEAAPSRYTFRFIDARGNSRWADMNVAPISWKGKPAILCLASDITKHKQDQELLRKSEKRLLDIIDFLPDATMVIDREGTVIAWNKAMVHLTEVPAEDMLSKGAYEYALPFYGERRPMLIDIALHPELEGHTDHARIYRSGDVMYAEALISDLPGEDLYLTATASVLRDTEGAVIGSIECFRNETERKNLEARLQQSEKMITLSRISAGVAHEILNPVGIISLELQTLKKMEALPQEAREELDVCMDQIRRIVAIADNLKQFARATKDTMAPDNVNDVIARVVQMYASQMKIEGVVTDVRYDASIPPVVLDRGKIEQVLINLFSNAMAAMEGKDEKFLVIRSQRVDTNEGSHARIVVADRGTGIEKKELQRIFDPFYTTRDQGRGTGMGLSIAHGIISQHGGQIWAENNEWGGASFFIELPVQKEIHQQQEE